ncbi:MAG: choice-of-anchor tandem repeat GloVer-containing protein [Cyanobacteria bacterium J06648_11]
MEGSKPNGSFAIASNGKLYGTTHGNKTQGGTHVGTLFSMQPDGSDFEVLHRFKGGDVGDTPMRTPTLAGDTLYGATAFGGGAEQDTPNVPPGYGLIYAFTVAAL